jgi:TonB family protein
MELTRREVGSRKWKTRLPFDIVRLMTSRIFLIILLSTMSALSARATEVYIPDRFKGIILYALGPVDYSNSGTQGVYRLTIDQKTGTVTEVGILKRSGYQPRDATAVLTFMQWKFKPGTLKQLDVPVTWDRQATVLLKNAGSK